MNTPTTEELTAAITRAIDAESLRLSDDANFVSVSNHAYHAGLRDGYLKVLRTLGVDYTPAGWNTDTPRLACTTATPPSRNKFDHHARAAADAHIHADYSGGRRTEVIEHDEAPLDFAALQAEIAEGVSA